jgi:hypothetical protein
MKKQYDIKFASRKYTTQDGQEKTYWSNHGTMWIEDDKVTIKLDSIPQSQNYDGYFKAFPHKPKEERNMYSKGGFPPNDYNEDF